MDIPREEIVAKRPSTRRPAAGRGLGTGNGTVRGLIEQTLRDVFGLTSLRAGQRSVVERILKGHSSLAIMPTGAGKSLCYQLPAVMLEGCTLVVSPLIALMKDQCEKLQACGVVAVQLSSHCTAQEVTDAENSIVDGTARVVLTTPERLAHPAFVGLLGQRGVALLVVDEAHCISQWGHDFRPAFLEIEAAWRSLDRPTVLALTATAPADVAKEIMTRLHIPATGCVDTGTFRPNLCYEVEHVEDSATKEHRLLELVRKTPGSGIVYTATVKAAEAVHAALSAAGIAAGLYHGRRSADERREAQEAFMADKTRVMVATNAFGMGIDKPDIRFVVHFQIPSGLDAYYQESGRAGRDGEPALCSLLFAPRDKALQQFFMAGRYPANDEIEAVYGALKGVAATPATDAATLARTLSLPRSKVQVAVQLLRQQKIVSKSSTGGLHVRNHCLDAPALQAMGEKYRVMRVRDREILERMVFYAQTGGCRWQVLLAHLQDDAQPVERCGTCDNCRRIAAQERLAAPIVIDEDGTEPQTIRKPAAFSPNQPVRVKRYGEGHVIAADDSTVTIEFEGGVQRCFAPGFVRPAQRRRTSRAAHTAEPPRNAHQPGHVEA